MIIDAHAHYHPVAYSEALAALPAVARGGGFPGHPDTDTPEDIERRLAMMHEAGVGLQVLSPAANRAPYSPDEAVSTAAAQMINDLSADLVSRHPERFKSFVTLPLPHIDASLRELERGIETLGMVGINLHISVRTVVIEGDQFRRLHDLRLPVLLDRVPNGANLGSRQRGEVCFGRIGGRVDDARPPQMLVLRRDELHIE